MRECKLGLLFNIFIGIEICWTVAVVVVVFGVVVVVVAVVVDHIPPISRMILAVLISNSKPRHEIVSGIV